MWNTSFPFIFTGVTHFLGQQFLRFTPCALECVQRYRRVAFHMNMAGIWWLSRVRLLGPPWGSLDKQVGGQAFPS